VRIVGLKREESLILVVEASQDSRGKELSPALIYRIVYTCKGETVDIFLLEENAQNPKSFEAQNTKKGKTSC